MCLTNGVLQNLQGSDLDARWQGRQAAFFLVQWANSHLCMSATLLQSPVVASCIALAPPCHTNSPVSLPPLKKILLLCFRLRGAKKCQVHVVKNGVQNGRNFFSKFVFCGNFWATKLVQTSATTIERRDV